MIQRSHKAPPVRDCIRGETKKNEFQQRPPKSISIICAAVTFFLMGRPKTLSPCVAIQNMSAARVWPSWLMQRALLVVEKKATKKIIIINAAEILVHQIHTFRIWRKNKEFWGR